MKRKKNHDGGVAVSTSNLVTCLGSMAWLRSKIFQLNNTKSYEDMGLTNIANTVSASQDEEVWGGVTIL